ncbi:hypothetical protein [Actinoplanes sp. DH11]|uniref:hypothetical protein n=1 Tax=Actinoplanes sp. DH11 TaxID=2857011 RepID=UPI001E4D0E5E|nr:hypothetical protein [Actinoplanes sp. DH11]
MHVVWSATELGSRRFCPTPVRSEPAELEDRFRRLRRRRIRGYVEVEIPGGGSSRVTIGFRGEYAVVHMVVTAPVPRFFVLGGDGSVPADAYVKVPVRDELARFTGDVVLEVHRAWDVVQAFTRTGQAGDLGEWRPLQPEPTGAET